eukprot:PhM_4_TR11377/c0_g1_i1/m.4489
MSASTKLPPVPVEILPPGKKISKKEVEGLTNRLFYQQEEKKKQNDDKRTKQLEDGTYHSKTIRSNELESLVDRVYSRPMERAHKAVEERDAKAKADAAAQRKVLSIDESNDMVARMYYTERERHKVRQEQLVAKYQPRTEKKRLTKEAQDAFAERNVTAAVARKKKMKDELFEKIILPRETTFRKLSPEEVKASAERLCQKKT